MSDFFSGVEDQIVLDSLPRGQGTGIASRICSQISLFVTAYLAVYLIEDKRYLVAALVLLLGFTRFGHWALFGLLIYFAIGRYWAGVALASLFLGVYGLATWLGARNIRRNLYSGRANIEPLEGEFDLLLAPVLGLAFFGFALLCSGIVSTLLWALFGLITVWQAGRFHYLLRSPWRRIHFPLMVRYAHIAGLETGLAQSTGSEFGFEGALRALVTSAYPHWDDGQVDLLISSARDKMTSFSDREALSELFKRRNPLIETSRLDEAMRVMERALTDPEEKGIRVRYVIAEVIGRDYGPQERLRYISSVLTGRE